MEPEKRFAGTHDLLCTEIKHEISPAKMVITEEMLERHAWANDDYNLWYINNSPFSGCVAPPTFVSYDTDIMMWNHFALPEGKGIWAKQAIRDKFIDTMVLYKFDSRASAEATIEDIEDNWSWQADATSINAHLDGQFIEVTFETEIPEDW